MITINNEGDNNNKNLDNEENKNKQRSATVARLKLTHRNVPLQKEQQLLLLQHRQQKQQHAEQQLLLEKQKLQLQELHQHQKLQRQSAPQWQLQKTLISILDVTFNRKCDSSSSDSTPTTTSTSTNTITVTTTTTKPINTTNAMVEHRLQGDPFLFVVQNNNSNNKLQTNLLHKSSSVTTTNNGVTASNNGIRSSINEALLRDCYASGRSMVVKRISSTSILPDNDSYFGLNAARLRVAARLEEQRLQGRSEDDRRAGVMEATKRGGFGESGRGDDGKRIGFGVEERDGSPRQAPSRENRTRRRGDVTGAAINSSGQLYPPDRLTTEPLTSPPAARNGRTSLSSMSTLEGNVSFVRRRHRRVNVRKNINRSPRQHFNEDIKELSPEEEQREVSMKNISSNNSRQASRSPYMALNNATQTDSRLDTTHGNLRSIDRQRLHNITESPRDKDLQMMYTDPYSDAPADFQRRVMQMMRLEEETKRWEAFTTASKINNNDSSEQRTSVNGRRT